MKIKEIIKSKLNKNKTFKEDNRLDKNIWLDKNVKIEEVLILDTIIVSNDKFKEFINNENLLINYEYGNEKYTKMIKKIYKIMKKIVIIKIINKKK